MSTLAFRKAERFIRTITRKHDLNQFKDILNGDSEGRPTFRLKYEAREVVKGLSGMKTADKTAVEAAQKSITGSGLVNYKPHAKLLLNKMKVTQGGIAELLAQTGLIGSFTGVTAYMISDTILRSIDPSKTIPAVLFLSSFLATAIVNYISYKLAQAKFVESLRVLATGIRDGINESEYVRRLFDVWLDGGNANPLIRHVITKEGEQHGDSTHDELTRELLSRFPVRTLDPNLLN
ncbi:MAG: hypothetical protein Q7S22_00295 [Candidatus Micrarchaeota archaeon]|nr:hypothetical protein [Candidatus Micrarchaeota archaeon]